MPHKGLPICDCGSYEWYLIAHMATSSEVECKRCRKRKKTRANNRYDLKREDDA